MSYGDSGIDRYEAQSIAEGAASSAAESAKRDIGYDIERLRDDVRRLERAELDAERQTRRVNDEELRQMLATLDSVVARATIN